MSDEPQYFHVRVTVEIDDQRVVLPFLGVPATSDLEAIEDVVNALGRMHEDGMQFATHHITVTPSPDSPLTEKD